ncbi:unnamed protein product [Trichogramma brassicae]|uniref:G-protein coupled receptors family 2 profile 1 domain-containing protein n=1 Tax=Trichogramma brassicae TaxID=86971 RepID=A0A6H5I794_9HYME|nr:unnamed protein product [Trichogramma brassicae]
MVLIETLPEHQILQIYDSLRKLNQRVLLKIADPAKLPPNLPENVITSPWIPQQAVLSWAVCVSMMTNFSLHVREQKKKCSELTSIFKSNRDECPPHFDGKYCWPSTPIESAAKLPCPIPYYANRTLTRECMPSSAEATHNVTANDELHFMRALWSVPVNHDCAVLKSEAAARNGNDALYLFGLVHHNPEDFGVDLSCIHVQEEALAQIEPFAFMLGAIRYIFIRPRKDFTERDFLRVGGSSSSSSIGGRSIPCTAPPTSGQCTRVKRKTSQRGRKRMRTCLHVDPFTHVQFDSNIFRPHVMLCLACHIFRHCTQWEKCLYIPYVLINVLMCRSSPAGAARNNYNIRRAPRDRAAAAWTLCEVDALRERPMNIQCASALTQGDRVLEPDVHRHAGLHVDVAIRLVLRGLVLAIIVQRVVVVQERLRALELEIRRQLDHARRLHDYSAVRVDAVQLDRLHDLRRGRSNARRLVGVVLLWRRPARERGLPVVGRRIHMHLHLAGVLQLDAGYRRVEARRDDSRIITEKIDYFLGRRTLGRIERPAF